jgi:hypothetical protein
MPRSRYEALSPVLKAFAEQHGLPYKAERDVDIWLRTWRTYRRVAGEAAVDGAAAPRRGVTM